MNETYLAHHGVKGQKWGVRRYQNEDGSFTDAGRRRYGLDRKGLRTNLSFNRTYVGNMAKALRTSSKEAFSGEGVPLKGLRAKVSSKVGIGRQAYKLTKFSKAGAARGRQHIKDVHNATKQHLIEKYGEEGYKKQVKKNIKRAATAAAIATALTAGTAAAIATNRNQSGVRERRYMSNAKKQYKDTQRVINGIKYNPEANNFGNQRAQSVLVDQTVERIKKNPNAVHVGNKYAKK